MSVIALKNRMICTECPCDLDGSPRRMVFPANTPPSVVMHALASHDAFHRDLAEAASGAAA